MERPKAHAFVRVGSLLALLRRLGGKVRPGRGWSVSELGGELWLSRGPRYFFSGQARRAENGVTLEPFWVRAFGATGFTLRPLQGAVTVPTPGVVCARVTWAVEWGPDPISPLVLNGVASVESVELVGAADVPAVRCSRVDYTFVGVPPDDTVEIISVQPVAVGVVVLATVDASGRVTHVVPAGGSSVGDAVVDVAMPPSEVYFEGVME